MRIVDNECEGLDRVWRTRSDAKRGKPMTSNDYIPSSPSPLPFNQRDKNTFRDGASVQGCAAAIEVESSVLIVPSTPWPETLSHIYLPKKSFHRRIPSTAPGRLLYRSPHNTNIQTLH